MALCKAHERDARASSGGCDRHIRIIGTPNFNLIPYTIILNIVDGDSLFIFGYHRDVSIMIIFYKIPNLST